LKMPHYAMHIESQWCEGPQDAARGAEIHIVG
jgi:hypothetical protein